MRASIRSAVAIAAAFGLSSASACSSSGNTEAPAADSGHDATVDSTSDDVSDSDSNSDSDVAFDSGDTCPAYVPITDPGSSPVADGGGTIPGPAPTACSATGTQPATKIVWQNDACETIETWWINFACEEVYYQDVPARGSRSQPTYVGHRWRLRAKGTHVLLKEVDGNVDSTPRTVTFP